MKIKSILLVICIFILGFFANDAYRIYTNTRNYDGMFIADEHNNQVSYSSAKETINKYDEYGIWVCTNAAGMDFKECSSTCSHECGHEVFANMLEKNPDIINKLIGLNLTK